MIEFKDIFYPSREFIAKDEKLYARVTATFKSLVDFSGIPKEILEAKAALGTRVHHCINEIIQGNPSGAMRNEVGYINSFEKWRNKIKPLFLESEARYYCDKHRISGQIDALVRLEGEEKGVLVDFKTSVQESPTWRIQGHLYHHLLVEAGKDISPKMLFIKLDRRGHYPEIFEYKLNATEMDCCFQAVEAFWEPYSVLS